MPGDQSTYSSWKVEKPGPWLCHSDWEMLEAAWEQRLEMWPGSHRQSPGQSCGHQASHLCSGHRKQLIMLPHPGLTGMASPTAVPAHCEQDSVPRPSVRLTCQGLDGGLVTFAGNSICLAPPNPQTGHALRPRLLWWCMSLEGELPF